MYLGLGGKRAAPLSARRKEKKIHISLPAKEANLRRVKDFSEAS
jgi:hypothetical protein